MKSYRYFFPLFVLLLLPKVSKADIPESIVPKTMLNFWEAPSIAAGNNCYNYATNRVTDDFAQPGYATTGKELSKITCEEVYNLASKDLGLEKTTFFELKGKNDKMLIALVVAPDYDFHWYRRDDSGYWTHKAGASYPTDKDHAGNVITSVEKAQRGIYVDFCGYFAIRNPKIETENEQNLGYVRIGNMKELPSYKNTSDKEAPKDKEPPKKMESYVELLLYSGRENPKLPLSTFLEDKKLGLILNTYLSGLKTNRLVKRPLPYQLGYRGVMIHDTEKLLSKKPLSLLLDDRSDETNSNLEKAFLEKFAQAGYQTP